MGVHRNWLGAIALGWVAAYLYEFVVLALLPSDSTPGEMLRYWLMTILIGSVPGLLLAGLIEALTRPLRSQWVPVLGHALVFGAVCSLLGPWFLLVVALPAVIGRMTAVPLVPLPQQQVPTPAGGRG